MSEGIGIWDSGSEWTHSGSHIDWTVTKHDAIQVRNNHALPNGEVLFSVAADGYLIAGKPTLWQLLRYWWRNR